MELIYKDEDIDYAAVRTLLEEAEREKGEADVAEEKLRETLKLSEDWYNYRPFDEIEVLKEISSYYSINLSEAQERISKMPDEPLIDGKPIPEIVKELRQIRRSLKGNAKVKMSNSIDHLIKAYAGHLDSCIANIYWLSPF